MKRLYVVSLGCPKNLVDTERTLSVFLKNGYHFSFNQNQCDSVLINTCAFIKSAVKESEEVINEFVDLKMKGKIKEIFVCGCLVSRFKKKLIDRYLDVDLFVDIESLDLLGKFLSGKINKVKLLSSRKYFYNPSRFLLTFPHIAYLKISDGCSNFCSYCTIPYIRGSFKSRKFKNIVDEAKLLADLGVKEIIIVSQDSLRYGIDLYSSYKIIKLLQNLEKINGIKWIRLLYLYPSLINDRLIKYIKQSEKIVNYFDIPIQHISNKILKLMNRKYDSKKVRYIIDRIYNEIPDASIRTNFIVGFPYEDEEDVKELIKFINQYPINYINVFKYSREFSTAAYNFKQIPKKDIDKRYKNISKLVSQKIDELNKRILSKEFVVLADTDSKARSYMDAPDIDGYFSATTNFKPSNFYKVRVITTEGLLRVCEIL
ncbi:MAG: 30S ribosomal protein S12 methylthiotransferase RimO [Elusimicrobiales bacterium]|nr:30S ribosomal protein S12 methylthiotransferase RimO [Elusimicrobiales bacterium]